ncbi:MAG: T9SS type A sorting domain-containing protein [Bacteroidetes bacterium]|nr:MAG: T9SS type A sorting domain-containing protein [Bacteroidota bacterium]
MKLFTFLIVISVFLVYLLQKAKAQPPDSSIVFTSGFEEGNKDIWDDYDDNADSTNLIMEDPGPFGKTGNHIMRFRVPPGRGGADIVKVLPGTYDRLYLRWYQKWEPGYDFNAKNHGGGLYAGPRNLLGRSNIRPNGTDLFCAYLEPLDKAGRLNFYSYYRGMYMDCVNPNGMCWGDHFPCWLDEGEHICTKPEHREKVLPPVMETGRWYCLEMTIDAGTPVQSDAETDGSMNFWIDGVEYGPFEHLWLRSTSALKLNILWLELFHHEAHSIEGVMLDEIVVATERIGCGTNEVNPSNSKNGNNIIISPNPFSEISIFNYQLSIPSSLKIDIYNSLGNKITTLVDEFQDVGQHQVEFNPEGLTQGMYFYTAKIGKKIESGKMILLR